MTDDVHSSAGLTAAGARHRPPPSGHSPPIRPGDSPGTAGGAIVMGSREKRPRRTRGLVLGGARKSPRCLSSGDRRHIYIFRLGGNHRCAHRPQFPPSHPPLLPLPLLPRAQTHPVFHCNRRLQQGAAGRRLRAQQAARAAQAPCCAQVRRRVVCSSIGRRSEAGSASLRPCPRPSPRSAVSGTVPEQPVVSKKSGHLYEKRLILKVLKV